MGKPVQSCRTCGYWGKPRGERALADYHYPCLAPMPSRKDFPASVFGTLDQRPMERDEGKECPVWTDTIPRAPT